ncbi:MAG: winged helix-turn-helix domain-containing protein [Woeseiaceae bacterium]|nr:winged helix-turn-helix domain-containing protein [Woeseiaceae bacterium]
MPKLSYRVFEALAQAAPNVLSQDELAAAVWPGRIVMPQTIMQRIKLLRQALGDDARAPRYVGLVRGEGYCLLPDVAIVSAEDEASTAPTRETGTSHWVRPALAAAILLSLLVLWLGMENGRWRSTLPSADETSVSTVAVLPFANATRHPDDAYLSIGLSDELRDQMGRLPRLRIAARPSSLQFTDDAIDPVSAARSLGVSRLVTGSLWRNGSSLRVSIDIIDGRSGFTEWSNSYESRDDDLLDLQRSISNDVAERLRPALTSLADVSGPLTVNASANDMMLVARQLFQQVRDDPVPDIATLGRVIALYRGAAALDPASAIAQSRLAAALLFANEVEAARDPVFRALAIDPDLSEVQHTRGLYLWRNYLPGAGDAYHRAVELNPSNIDALGDLAIWTWSQGNTLAAEPFYLEALSLDPLTISRYANIGNFYGVSGYRDKALDIAERLDVRFGDNERALLEIARIHELVGDLDTAIGWALRAHSINPRYRDASWMLSELYARLHDETMARHFVAEAAIGNLFYLRRYETLIELAEDHVLSHPEDRAVWYMLVRAWAATGRYEQAIFELRRLGLPDVVFVDSRRTTALEALVSLADSLKESGNRQEAHAIGQWLTNFYQNAYDLGTQRSWWINLYLACSLSITDADDAALTALERIPDNPGHAWYPVLRDQPCFRRFEANPRYQAVLRHVEQQKLDLRERLPETLAAMGVPLP